MSEIKFKLTTESKINILGIKLFRIEATASFGSISKGDQGGWVQSEKTSNGDARVSGNAWVSGNAEVFGDARVFGNAWVSGDARVSGNAEVFGDALNTGWCFAYQHKDWNVTNVPTVDKTGFLLVKDYKEPIQEPEVPKEIEVDGHKYKLIEE